MKSILALFVLLSLLLLSFQLRQPETQATIFVPGMESTYHVLLTVNALSESGIKNHYLLPTVTLGRETDKGIPWGGTVPTLTGDYIYTSFTSAGFLAPYLWFEMLHQQPTLQNLAQFNWVVGSVAAVILFFFLVSLLQFYGVSHGVALVSALTAISIGIFSREALLSFGILYWAQSLYHVVLISSTFLVFKYLSKATQKSPAFISNLIILFSFIGALIEWTGFIYNIGLAFVLWNRSDGDFQERRGLAQSVLIATGFAGVFIFFHFGLAVGFEPAISAFINRFFARNTSVGSFSALSKSYALSYGLFIPLVFGFLVMGFMRYREHGLSRVGILWSILAISCIPLLENIILLQHATQFSFDRLKFILPASIGIACGLAMLGPRLRVICIFLILGVCIQNFATYKKDLKIYAKWQEIDERNHQLKDLINADPLSDCAVYATNLAVRGYANLLFHRGIYEYIRQKNMGDLIQIRRSCAGIFIEATGVFLGQPEYTSATITHLDGSVKKITLTE